MIILQRPWSTYVVRVLMVSLGGLATLFNIFLHISNSHSKGEDYRGPTFRTASASSKQVLLFFLKLSLQRTVEWVCSKSAIRRKVTCPPQHSLTICLLTIIYFCLPSSLWEPCPTHSSASPRLGWASSDSKRDTTNRKASLKLIRQSQSFSQVNKPITMLHFFLPIKVFRQ